MASGTSHLQRPGILKDCPVRAIVGHQQTTYYIHPGVLASSGSPVLEARVSDRWIENGSNEAIGWSDFDEGTVECALSYLYTGDYGVPTGMNVEERCPDDKKYDAISSSQQETSTPDKVSLVSKPTASDYPFLRWPLMPLSQSLQSGLPPKIMPTAAGSFVKMHNACDDEYLGDLVFTHAKVYCFAHRFLFSKLEKFALQRLTEVLSKCDKPTESFSVCLADSVRLIYNATPASKISDPARELLSQYIALKYTIIPERNLSNLVAEGGDFAIDLTRKLARGASRRGQSNNSLEYQIDELPMKVLSLEEHARDKSSLPQKADDEIYGSLMMSGRRKKRKDRLHWYSPSV